MSKAFLGRLGFLCFSLLFFPLTAVPVGNPALPSLLQEGIFISDLSWCNPQLGLTKDFLISKRLSPTRTSRNLGLHRALLRGTSEVAILAWSIRERFNFQIELGSGQYSWQWKEHGLSIAGRSSNGLLWTGNGKLVVLDMKDTSLAADIHAGGWNWMEGPAIIDGTPQKNKTSSTLQYWQIGLALAQKMHFFAPYLGIAINHTHFRVKGLVTGKSHMRSRHYTGPFGGCTLSTGSQFLLNLEWRGWFEEGFSVSCQFRF